MNDSVGEAGKGSRGEPAELDDVGYFRAVEEVFLSLRGAPLLLSAADFQVAREWRREGIPLDVVTGALTDLFERRRERETAGRVNSLRYCRPAVERAWRRVEQLVASGAKGSPERFDLGGRLAALAAALPDGLPGRRRLASRIGALEGEVDEVEGALADLDASMLEAARGALDEEASAGLAAAVDRRLEDLAGRLGESELREVRGRLETREIRRRFDLPVLSLFATEAVPDRGAAPEPSPADARPGSADRSKEAPPGGDGDREGV